jgi:N-acyl-L-homoserine lactone synthetase
VSIVYDEMTDSFSYFNGGNLPPASTEMIVVIRFHVRTMSYQSSDTDSTHEDISICTLKSCVNMGLGGFPALRFDA